MDSINKAFAFQEKALNLRSYRQQLISSNIANADTPRYNAVDIDFADAMRKALAGITSGLELNKTNPRHLDGQDTSGINGVKPLYRNVVQPSIDGNTVDSNIEQAQFTENSLNYMSTLTFINNKIVEDSTLLKGNN